MGSKHFKMGSFAAFQNRFLVQETTVNHRARTPESMVFSFAPSSCYCCLLTCKYPPPISLSVVCVRGFARSSPKMIARQRSTTVTNSHAQQRQTQELSAGIADFYDESSDLWESIWGEHMHHGFYDVPVSSSSVNHSEAQIRMIEEALQFAGISEEMGKRPRRILDVGCGIGGSSRYLAKKFQAQVDGITLSPFQVRRATELASEQGLADQVFFQVADALNQPFPDNHFDLVWSMESAEHMPDKEKFLQELTRVAAPGGSIIIVTWCHRVLLPGEVALKPDEKNFLDKICTAFYLPDWCSVDDYVKIGEALSLERIKNADWSDNVSPFWGAVIKSAISLRGILGILKSGWKTFKGALAMPYMAQGFKCGLIKFVVITATKPVISG